MLDTLRTLLWVNGKRIKAGRLPRLWMPANTWSEGQARSRTCPLAKALPGTASTWDTGYSKIVGDVSGPAYAIPPYVSRFVVRSDQELRT